MDHPLASHGPNRNAKAPGPYCAALERSHRNRDQHPSLKAGDQPSAAQFMRIAHSAALFGCSIERRLCGTYTAGIFKGFVAVKNLPRLDGADHGYVLVDLEDARPGRVVGVVLDTYRPLDDAFRAELSAWCSPSNLVWHRLGGCDTAIHWPLQSAQQCSLLIQRREPGGGFPPLLVLEGQDKREADAMAEHIRQLNEADRRDADAWLIEKLGPEAVERWRAGDLDWLNVRLADYLERHGRNAA